MRAFFLGKGVDIRVRWGKRNASKSGGGALGRGRRGRRNGATEQKMGIEVRVVGNGT